MRPADSIMLIEHHSDTATFLEPYCSVYMSRNCTDPGDADQYTCLLTPTVWSPPVDAAAAVGAAVYCARKQLSGLLVCVCQAHQTTAGNTGHVSHQDCFRLLCKCTRFANSTRVVPKQDCTWPPGGGGAGGVSPHTTLPPLTALAGSTGRPPGMAPHSVGFPGFSTLRRKAQQ